MSKKNKKQYKKNRNKAKAYNPKQLTAFSFRCLRPELVGYIAAHPEEFKEIRLKEKCVEEIPGEEIRFPISGNLFLMKLLQNGDDAGEVAAAFSTHLLAKYTTRQFCSTISREIVYAVDAPEEEVLQIWNAIMLAYNYEGYPSKEGYDILKFGWPGRREGDYL